MIIVFAGVAAYANSLHGPFIFDDYRAIRDNLSIRQLWPLAPVLAAAPQTAVAGRPVVNLSFGLNYAAGGLNVTGYHLTNLTIHLLAALVLFGILRRTPPLDRASPRATTDALALASALIWTVHPLNTEAVDYLTQRTELLAGLFSFAALYCSIRAGSASANRGWAVAAVAACALGMASKESAVTVPLLIVLYDRVFVGPSLRRVLELRWRFYLSLAGTWAVFVGLVGQGPFFRTEGFATTVSSWTYLLNQAPLIVRYLRLAIWPHALVLDYGVPAALSFADVALPALIVVALGIAVLVAIARAPRIGFWGAWFFITLAPSSSVLPIPTEVGAERRMYLPLVAIVVLGVWATHALIRRAIRISANATPPANERPIEAVALVAAVAALTVLTSARNAEYRSGVTVWETVVARHPHPRAHLNLAAELHDAGRTDDAVVQLRIAAPDLPDARRALAVEMMTRQDYAGAAKELSEFVRLKPSDPDIITAREALAQALVATGNLRDAAHQLRAIVALAPDYPIGHVKLGEVLMAQRDFSGAAAEYRECLRTQPNNVTALAHLGRALASLDRPDEAIASFSEALRRYPGFDEARRDLIQVLTKAERFPDVERESRTLLASSPGDAETRNSLGIALAAQGRLDEAIVEFSEAVRLQPDSPARGNLARAEQMARGSGRR